MPLTLSPSDMKPKMEITGRYDTIKFGRPSLDALQLHAQMMCLAEGQRPCVNDVQQVVTACRGDLRQVGLALQMALAGSAPAGQVPGSTLVSLVSGVHHASHAFEAAEHDGWLWFGGWGCCFTSALLTA